MKVEVVEGWSGFNSYKVRLSQGSQSFKLNSEGTKQEAEWMAKMFRKALKAHDRAKEAK
jgi:hypothetical protein